LRRPQRGCAVSYKRTSDGSRQAGAASFGGFPSTTRYFTRSRCCSIGADVLAAVGVMRGPADPVSINSLCRADQSIDLIGEQKRFSNGPSRRRDVEKMHRRVRTERNGDVGRGAFFRILPATSTHGTR
jgi:hypothetical protein